MIALVVDDSISVCMFVSGILEDVGVEATTASSGEEALDYVKNKDYTLPDLVFMDVGLPGIDGYETASAIRTLVEDKHIPIIFLTGSKEQDVLSRCLEVGDDYIEKPVAYEIIAAKAKAHLRVAALYQELDAQYQTLKRYYNQITLEHDLVDNIFKRHFQRNFIDSDNFRYHISPSSVFNGDVLLAAHGPLGNLYILVGDVTGHGLPAAVSAIPVYSTFLTMAEKGLSVGTIAAEMNKVLRGVMPENMMMAACIIELNSAADQINVWSGGLPPAILADSSGNIKQLISPEHCPLAMLEEDEFSQNLQIFAVGPDDRIYLFTDGVEESRNEKGEMFGETRLLGLFDGSCSDMYGRVLEQLAKFTESLEQGDDITLVELACRPAKEAPRKANREGRVKALPWSLSFTLGVDEIQTSSPVPQIVRLLSNAIGVDVHQDFVSTLLSELYANALDHGLLQLESSLKSTDDGFIEYYQQRKQRLSQLEEGVIDIKISLSHEVDGTRILIRVKDSGPGFDYSQKSVVDENASYGRGLSLVRDLCERVEYSEGGSCVTATYRI